MASARTDRLLYEAPRIALDHVQGPALIVELTTGRVSQANTYAANWLGYSRQELQGTPLSVLLSPADSPGPLSQAIAEAAESHAPAPIRRRGVEGAGGASEATVQFLDEGRTMALIVVNDPAAPLPTKLAILDPRARALLDFAYDAYSDYDIITGYIDFSEQMDHILGYPPGGCPRTFFDWAHLLHPDEYHRVLKELKVCLRSDATTWTSEYRLRRRDGSYVLVLDQCIILTDEYGRKSHMVGAVRDITEERKIARSIRESAELYRSLFVDNGSPAFRLDSGHRYVDANAAALDFFECRLEDLVGRGVTDHFPSEFLALLSPGAPAEARGSRRFSLTIDGMTKVLSVDVVHAQMESEETYFCLGHDATASETLEKSLRDANTALKVFVEQMHRDRKELEDQITLTIRETALPILDRLGRLIHSPSESAYIEALERTLAETFRPFSATDSSREEGSPSLTRREREIVNFVRLGKTTEEIAELLRLSTSAVQFHRSNIRRKLGLKRGGPQLNTYLESLSLKEQ